MHLRFALLVRLTMYSVQLRPVDATLAGVQCFRCTDLDSLLNQLQALENQLIKQVHDLLFRRAATCCDLHLISVL